METCPDCRASFQELVALCGELAGARLPADDAEAGIVERVVSAVIADEQRRTIVGTAGETVHAAFLTRSLKTWRWVMSSPVSLLATAAVFLLAITGVALMFHGGGETYALADFIAPILETKSARFKVTSEIKGPPASNSSGEVMVLDAMRTRQETQMATFKMVMIFDWGRGKALALDPGNKRATVFTIANMAKEQISQQDIFSWFRSMLLDARDKPDVKRESLGQQDIDGRRAVGFRINWKGTVMTLWGDPKTGLPIRVEATMGLFPSSKVIMTDFVFNVALDESQFSIEPPAGYSVQNMKIDASQPQEKDLIDTFRESSKLSGGTFPDSLDMEGIMKLVMKKFLPGIGGKPSDQQMQTLVETQARLQRGSMFALMLPPDADAHYAGKGISLGAPARPIFWYHPKDAQKYRVIYADLSVHEADAPLNVPNEQRLPAIAAPKK